MSKLDLRDAEFKNTMADLAEIFHWYDVNDVMVYLEDNYPELYKSLYWYFNCGEVPKKGWPWPKASNVTGS